MTQTRRDLRGQRGGAAQILLVFLLVGAITIGVTWVLVEMVDRKQEAKTPYLRLVEDAPQA